MSSGPEATSDLLTGKVAIVTGVRGIGAGVAEALMAAGASVVLVDVNGEQAETTSRALGGPPAATPAVCDVSDRSHVDAMVAATVERTGRIDIVVNTAQMIQPIVPVAEMTKAHMAMSLDSGVWGTFNVMQACYPHLKVRGGAVVNFGSSAGTHGAPGLGGYATAKEGIRGLSRVAALEWGKDRITVNVVCPAVLTPLAKAWAENHPDRYRHNLERRPIPRDGDAVTDIGATVAFLVGPGATFITGETMMITGGGSLG